MTQPTPRKFEDVAALFEQISSVIHGAMGVIRQGELVDLSNLQTMAGAAHEAFLGLKKDDQEKLKEKLMLLIDDLNHLQKMVFDQKEEVFATLSKSSEHGLATDAYKKNKP